MSEDAREAVLQIYDAVADPSLWPDVLQRVAEQVNAVGCIMFEWQTAPAQRKLAVSVASSYYDPAQIDVYIDRFFEEEARDQDIFEAHSLLLDRIDLVQDDVLAPSLEALKERPNVQTLQKLGILHRAAGLLNKDNSARSRFSVQLGADRGRLTETEQKHLGLILPHVAKAYDLGGPAKQLADEHYGMLSAMDRLSIGVCILDSNASVVIKNEEFRRQLAEYLVFRVDASGKLILTKDADQKRFEMLRADALNHGKYGARPRKEALSADEDVFLCVEVAPLHKSQEIGSKAFDGCIVYSSDTSLPFSCQTLPIKTAYKLTDAEMSLVDAIAEGLTNTQIAEQKGRAVPTINAQVKSILSKTQCATRTQFVRLMMSFGTDFLAADRKSSSL